MRDREGGLLHRIMQIVLQKLKRDLNSKKGKQVEKVKAYVVACWLGSLWDIEVIAGKHREK